MLGRKNSVNALSDSLLISEGLDNIYLIKFAPSHRFCSSHHEHFVFDQVVSELSASKVESQAHLFYRRVSLLSGCKSSIQVIDCPP